MSRLLSLVLPLAPLLLLGGCKSSKQGTDTSPTTTPGASVTDVAETEAWTLEGLQCPAHVVRVEGSVPHIYAHDRVDLARVFGFVQARDRYFSMELARRLGLGQVSSLLGDSALETDMDSRESGMTFVAEQILASLTPEHAALLDAYAEGVNAYVAAVKAGDLPVPDELILAGGILGEPDPTNLLSEFDRAALAATLAVLVYELGYETEDVGKARSVAQLVAGPYDAGVALHDARTAGAVDDLFLRIRPIWGLSSAPGYGLNAAAGYATGNAGGAGYDGPDGPLPPPGAPLSGDGVLPPGASAPVGRPLVAPPVPLEALDRLWARLERQQKRLGRDDEVGWGSNAWAVAGASSKDGTTLVAGDGHLPLTVPSLFYSVGLDTKELGGGDLRQVGLTIPGLPFMAVGTNGDVAWSQTQLGGDITDWYSEELQLDADGAPSASRFQGAWEPVVAVPEVYEIADVPILGSEGRTETWTRYTTFDGRFIAEIEGTRVGASYEPAAGETIVMLGGNRIVPGDTDGDGKVTAISFDYAGFQAGHLLEALDGMGTAGDIDDFRAATRHLVAYSQNLAAGDKDGSILYTGFQGLPCRGYLERDADGNFAEGADPTMLIDGTRYGGFDIPIDSDGYPVEDDDDPYHCVVPFDAYPQSQDPASGYVLTANNDPVGTSFDDNLFNDPWYIGGPWEGGFRASRIDHELARLVAADAADEQAMADLQADVRSVHGCLFTPYLLDAIAAGRAAVTASPEPGTAEARLASLYLADQARFEEVEARLSGWQVADCPALSGVATSYHPSVDDDEAEMSVATTIFNAWEGRFMSRVFDDESLPGGFQGGGRTGRTRAMLTFLDGRGADNPLALSSWVEQTGESAFFDTLGTDELETADEHMLAALSDGLDFLESEPTSDVRGSGYGTADMREWRWGLRHMVRFDSILGEFLGDDPTYSLLTDQFAITPDVLPIADDIPAGDPRANLPHFPRPGDNDSVDAANAGFSGRDFTYGSGPVFRMVIALGPYGVEGRNILPGGQSALVDSEFFADQAAMWLGNEAWPIRYSLDQVIAGATGREAFSPAGGASCD